MVPIVWCLVLLQYLHISNGFFTPPSNPASWMQGGTNNNQMVMNALAGGDNPMWDLNQLLGFVTPATTIKTTTTPKPVAIKNGQTIKIGDQQLSISDLLNIVQNAVKPTPTPKPTTAAPILSAIAALFDPKLFQIAVGVLPEQGTATTDTDVKDTKKPIATKQIKVTTTTTTTPAPKKTTPPTSLTLAEILREKEIKAATIEKTSDGTIKEKGCIHKGIFYRPSSEIERGQTGDWCYGTYCNHDGVLVHWDDQKCSTPAPTTPTPEPTTPNTMGCFYRGRWYAPGEDIENSRTHEMCYGSYCDFNSKIKQYEEVCSATVPPPHGAPTSQFGHDPYAQDPYAQDHYAGQQAPDPYRSPSDPFSLMAASLGGMGSEAGGASGGHSNPLLAAFGGGAGGAGGAGRGMDLRHLMSK